MKNVAIIGAGIGGLATAARLAYKGYDVDVYEKLAECGGRAHFIKDKGFFFDTGPSFILMPDFFKELFEYCDQPMDKWLDLMPLETSYKIHFPDGDSLTIYRDSELTKRELERIEPGSAESYDEFMQKTEIIYNALRPYFNVHLNSFNILTNGLLKTVPVLNLQQSYWQMVCKIFKSQKLRHVFTFEAMFLGVSPFKSPAVYSIICYADHKQKIFHPRGGMYQVPLAIEKMAKSFGAKFHYNCEINRIEKNDKFILRSTDKEFYHDSVVVNADYSYTQTELLQRKEKKYDYSCSVYLLYMGLKQKVKGVEHHALYFSDDMDRNLDQIFDHHSYPDCPSFYLHAPTVTDSSLAPEGKEIFYILIPTPNHEILSYEEFEHEKSRLRKFVVEKLNKVHNIDLESLIEVEHEFIPQDFTERYNIAKAATFGLAHTFRQTAFMRERNQDKKLKGMYYVGASVQPGGGVPTCIASSRLTTDLICKNK